MAQQRLSHAYMLVGPDGDARGQEMIRLAAALLCSEPDAPCGRCRDCRKVYAGIHPDVSFIERLPGDKGQLRREIVVDQIRQAASDAFVAPNEAQRKVYVIREADRLNIAAQNALLKALEEPPGHACFLLCTTAADALLPTVRSRCVRVNAGRAEELAPLSEHAEGFLRLAAAGDIADMTRFCLLRGRLPREDADALLEEISGALCDILCARRSMPGLGTEQIFTLAARIDRAREFLRRNISAKQVFGMIAAGFEVGNDRRI